VCPPTSQANQGFARTDAVFNDSEHMLGPKRQRSGLFGAVGCPIINASNAPAVAGDVVQDRFDDMGLHAQSVHDGRGRSSQIMQAPWRNWGPRYPSHRSCDRDG
jgi:hypothetical protein